MRERVIIGFSEIDSFLITLPFSSEAQEQVFLGQRGVANITLSAYIVCIEPIICDLSPDTTELLSGDIKVLI